MSDQTENPVPASAGDEQPQAAGEAAPASETSPPNGKPKAATTLQPIPFEPANATELFRYAGQLAKSTLLPGSLTGKPDNVFLVLLKGQDLGLRPMQSIGSIHVIEGKAEAGAHLMVALVLQSPDCEYFFCENAGGAREKATATYVTRRRGWPPDKEMRVTWDVERAKEAGLYGRPTKSGQPSNWDRMPMVMCKRRASAELCRDVYPDVVLGMYDHGELSELGLTREQVDGAIEVTPADAAEKAADVKDRVRAAADRMRADDPPPSQTTRVADVADVVLEKIVERVGVPAELLKDPALEEPEWARPKPAPSDPAEPAPITDDERAEIAREEREQARRERRDLFDLDDDQ